METLNTVKQAVRALEDKKAEDIVILRVDEQTVVCKRKQPEPDPRHEGCGR